MTIQKFKFFLSSDLGVKEKTRMAIIMCICLYIYIDYLTQYSIAQRVFSHKLHSSKRNDEVFVDGSLEPFASMFIFIVCKPAASQFSSSACYPSSSSTRHRQI